MVIVESVALAIMVSNDIVMPLVLKRRAALHGEPQRCRRAAFDHAPHRDLRHPVARLHLLPLGRRGAARRDRAAVLRGGGAVRAGVFRRAGLAARHGARRHRRHERAAFWSGPIRCCCRAFPTPASSARSILTDGPWGLALLRPQALFGLDLPPLVHGVLLSLARQYRLLYRLLADAPPDARSSGCRPICSCPRRLRRWRRASGCAAPRSPSRN